MTTYSPADAVIDHTSNAGFQAWGLDLWNALTNGGGFFGTLTQSADTGQLALATLAAAARPATNTALGYWIFYVNDSKTSTAPLYIKVEVGTGSAATTAGVWITIATGSNGAGTLNGTTVFARTQHNLVPVNVATTRKTRACSVSGAPIQLVWKNQGVNTASSFVLSIQRSVDSSAALTDHGFFIMVGGANSQISAISFNSQSLTVIAASIYYCLIPGSITNSLVGGVASVFKMYAAFGTEVLPCLYTCDCVDAELPALTSFTATLISGSHTYLPLALGGSQTANTNNLTTHDLCIIWE